MIGSAELKRQKVLPGRLVRTAAFCVWGRFAGPDGRFLSLKKQIPGPESVKKLLKTIFRLRRTIFRS
jgi:hypothetical protein